MTAADIHAIFGDMTIWKVAFIILTVFWVCGCLAGLAAECRKLENWE
jgi:hypothetical protein